MGISSRCSRKSLRLALFTALTCIVLSFRTRTSLFFVQGAPSSDSTTPTSTSEVPHYEWDDWNYYQMLGFGESSSSSSQQDYHKVTAQDIKAAYRQQAKKWHPDKVLHNTTVTVEERNARFTKIAEAYQVLMDPQQRQEYDEYLKDYEKTHKSVVVDDDSHSYFWKNVNWKDPRTVFEEFFSFFDSDEGDDESSHFTDFREELQEKPFHMDQQETVYWDPYYGEVLRLIQHDIYADRTNPDQMYFRVMEQHFVEYWDPARRNFVLHPISQSHLIDEGYRTSNLLFPTEGLTSSDIPLRYGPYIAKLTPFCDLQILEFSSLNEEEEEIIWSTDTEWHTCQLRIRGSQLVLVDRYGQLLWSSGENDERGSTRRDAVFARLDSDASLTVYRVEPFHLPSLLEELEEILPPSMIRILAKPFLSLMVEDDDNESLVRLRCLSTTSPLGCTRALRLLVQVWRKTMRTIRKLDALMEKVFHIMTE